MPAEPEKTHIARELKYAKPLIACRFDPTGKAVFAGAEDDTVQRWDLETGKPLGEPVRPQSVSRTVVLSSDGKTVIFKTRNRAIEFEARHYLLTFALPNFYFHVTTAYAILRHKGVPLAKPDYLGKE